MKPDFLYGVATYWALAFCAGVLLVRYLIGTQRPPAPPVRAWAAGGWLWRLSTGVLIAAHAVMLLAPGQLLVWNRSALRLLTAEALCFVAGVAVVVGLAETLRRHFRAQEGSLASQLADIACLALLLVAAVSGVVAAVRYRWGLEWSGAILAPYVQSLVRGQPRTETVSAMPFAISVHVLSAFALLVVLPFTRAAGRALCEAREAWRLAQLRLAPPWKTAWRASLRWLQARCPMTWIWPEEEGE